MSLKSEKNDRYSQNTLRSACLLWVLLMWFRASQMYWPMSSFLTGFIKRIPLSCENVCRSLGPTNMLFFSHLNWTFVPCSTEQVSVTLSLSSTISESGVLLIMGMDTGTGGRKDIKLSAYNTRDSLKYICIWHMAYMVYGSPFPSQRKKIKQ